MSKILESDNQVEQVYDDDDVDVQVFSSPTNSVLKDPSKANPFYILYAFIFLTNDVHF